MKIPILRFWKKDFSTRLASIRHEAYLLGLYATMHRLEAAQLMYGFEIDGDIGGCLDYERKSANAAKGAGG